MSKSTSSRLNKAKTFESLCYLTGAGTVWMWQVFRLDSEGERLEEMGFGEASGQGAKIAVMRAAGKCMDDCEKST